MMATTGGCRRRLHRGREVVSVLRDDSAWPGGIVGLLPVLIGTAIAADPPVAVVGDLDLWVGPILVEYDGFIELGCDEARGLSRLPDGEFVVAAHRTGSGAIDAEVAFDVVAGPCPPLAVGWFGYHWPPAYTTQEARIRLSPGSGHAVLVRDHPPRHARRAVGGGGRHRGRDHRTLPERRVRRRRLDAGRGASSLHSLRRRAPHLDRLRVFDDTYASDAMEHRQATLPAHAPGLTYLFTSDATTGERDETHRRSPSDHRP